MTRTRRTVYLDHSATTPTDQRVVDAMLPYFTEIYGNPSSNHSFGRKAERAVEDARESVAKLFNCTPQEIIFTSGGSEGDNLAIRGAAWSAKQRGKGNHLITTPVEHSAVGKTVGQLDGMMGFDQTILPVNKYGGIDVEEFTAACRDETVIASVIYANNEVGTINPLPQLAEQAKARGILLHTDAVQAAGQLTLDVETLGVDLMSISGHKFYGPKGVGALYIRSGTEILPGQTGGTHEHGLRAGTHNTAFIVGMAKALELAYTDHEAHLAHYRQMRDALIDGILTGIPDVQLTGDPEQRLPSHASFVFEGIESNQLLMYLDMKGVAASAASACKTGNPEPSGVLLAMGYPRDLASGSLRLSVGRQTTNEDIDYALQVIIESVETVRKLHQAFAS